MQTGQYNKIAFLKKLLDETDPAAAEWILYAEPEMVIDDPAFTFPFEFYAGRDLVSTLPRCAACLSGASLASARQCPAASSSKTAPVQPCHSLKEGAAAAWLLLSATCCSTQSLRTQRQQRRSHSGRRRAGAGGGP